jgi:AraC-like DNA-binding protein
MSESVKETILLGYKDKLSLRTKQAIAEPSDEELILWGQSHHRSYQRLWQVDFQMLEEMPLSPKPISLSRQVVVSDGYYSNGRLRAANDHCYFCYSLAGKGLFWDERGVRPVPEGWAFLVEINDPRTGYRAEPNTGQPWEFLAFEFTGLAATALVRDLLTRYGSIFALSLQSPILQRLLSYETENYAVVHPHAMDGAEMVIELLLTLAASARIQEEPDAARDLVKQAMQLIEEQGDTLFTVTDLAQRVGVSRERLARVFRSRLNLSPHQLIQEQKIRRACFLLKDTQMPTKQIAAQLGYTDCTNFIRAFRQVMQMTPHEFYLRGGIRFPLRVSPMTTEKTYPRLSEPGRKRPVLQALRADRPGDGI